MEELTWYESTTAKSELSPVSYVTVLFVVFSLHKKMVLKVMRGC